MEPILYPIPVDLALSWLQLKKHNVSYLLEVGRGGVSGASETLRGQTTADTGGGASKWGWRWRGVFGYHFNSHWEGSCPLFRLAWDFLQDTTAFWWNEGLKHACIRKVYSLCKKCRIQIESGSNPSHISYFITSEKFLVSFWVLVFSHIIWGLSYLARIVKNKYIRAECLAYGECWDSHELIHLRKPRSKRIKRENFRGWR